MKTIGSQFFTLLAATTAVAVAVFAGNVGAADFNPQPDPPGKTSKGDAVTHNPPTYAVATPAEKCSNHLPSNAVDKKTETRSAAEIKQQAADKKLNTPKAAAADCVKK